MIYLEPSAEWVEGVGRIIYWLVVDSQGTCRGKFSEREDAEERLLEELRLKEGDYYVEESPCHVDC